MAIADNISQTQQQIAQFEQNHQRAADSVKLLAVSKTKPVSAIEDAYAQGQRLFGENYVQEAADKSQQLAHLEGIEWHFIGPIQSNKTRIVAESMHWVHTLDRAKIALRLNEQRPSNLAPLNVCIQVNISGEESKSGISLAELDEMVEIVGQQSNLILRGLMAIPAPQISLSAQVATYQPLYQAYQALADKIVTVDTLSIGMSGDMEAAIASGSTMVRIGTAIFGARNYA
ncbi:YggS family pyridoxal phosphate enzyme [Marinomonas sp. 42_23_T18]|nr:YggS family pyridoxal phosphate enzyme [Marinomonas sp. 42_23_T18]